MDEIFLYQQIIKAIFNFMKVTVYKQGRMQTFEKGIKINYDLDFKVKINASI